MRRDIWLPKSFVHGADGGFVVGTGFLEAGEVVGAKQKAASLIHSVKIQHGIAALPGISPQERVLLPMQKVGVFAASGAEAGVEIVGHRRY